MFQIDGRLAGDTLPVCSWALSQVRLMNNRAFPWLILVPARPAAREIHALDAADRARLMEEMAHAARVLEALCRPDKINVGALGNIVEQLHVHVIARRRDDPAWPGPVWGSGKGEPYVPGEGERTAAELAAVLGTGP